MALKYAIASTLLSEFSFTWHRKLVKIIQGRLRFFLPDRQDSGKVRQLD